MNILVTGISRGLGLEIATTLLQQGSVVYGVGRTVSERLQELQAQFGGRLFYQQVDLGDPSTIKQVVFHDLVPYEVQLHGFVNNAAAAYDDIITNLDDARLEAMFKVNVFAPMIMTKFVLRNMLLHKTRGSIVHISSISAHTGYKGLAMYAATKGAMEAFSKNTAREWGPRGVRSNCLVAGFMETDMSSVLTEEQKGRIYARTSLKKQVSANSVAETVAFLLSDSARSVTGQNIFVDSGTI